MLDLDAFDRVVLDRVGPTLRDLLLELPRDVERFNEREEEDDPVRDRLFRELEPRVVDPELREFVPSDCRRDRERSCTGVVLTPGRPRLMDWLDVFRDRSKLVMLPL